VCNGFQILCEAGLLPGALMRNARLTFVSRPVALRLERNTTAFTSAYRHGQVLRMPVSHGDGRFVADDETLRRIEGEGLVVVRYATPDDNPNGSVHDIAGVCNAAGNVVGLMPHPDRAADPLVGSADGLGFFTSMLAGIPAEGVR
jgi:phosphoribosylformylglycinamidine synthase